MTSIELTSGYNILVRRNSLPERSLSLDQLLRTLDTAKPFSEDENLLTFGPSFGMEAVDEFIKRLQTFGLIYWDDFFEFRCDYPSWCTFRAEYRA